jgi:uncharacterized alkaline shock family protein YloU
MATSSPNLNGSAAQNQKLGTVRIAPGVLETIVQLATLGVDGVLRMGEPNPPSLGRIFHREDTVGVKLDVKEGKVYADLYIVVDKDANIGHVGKQVQLDVSRHIRQIIGMPVEQINVYIQNVE